MPQLKTTSVVFIMLLFFSACKKTDHAIDVAEAPNFDHLTGQFRCDYEFGWSHNGENFSKAYDCILTCTLQPEGRLIAAGFDFLIDSVGQTRFEGITTNDNLHQVLQFSDDFSSLELRSDYTPQYAPYTSHSYTGTRVNANTTLPPSIVGTYLIESTIREDQASLDSSGTSSLDVSFVKRELQIGKHGYHNWDTVALTYYRRTEYRGSYLLEDLDANWGEDGFSFNYLRPEHYLPGDTLHHRHTGVRL